MSILAILHDIDMISPTRFFCVCNVYCARSFAFLLQKEDFDFDSDSDSDFWSWSQSQSVSQILCSGSTLFAFPIFFISFSLTSGLSITLGQQSTSRTSASHCQFDIFGTVLSFVSRHTSPSALIRSLAWNNALPWKSSCMPSIHARTVCGEFGGPGKCMTNCDSNPQPDSFLLWRPFEQPSAQKDWSHGLVC